MNRRTSILTMLTGCLLSQFKKTYYNWEEGHDKAKSTGPVLLDGKHITMVLWCDTRRGIVCHLREDKNGIIVEREDGSMIGVKKFYKYGNVEVLPKTFSKG